MYDIAFIGHTCLDEVVPHGAPTYRQAGSAVLCGAQVAARVGKSVAAVVKMCPADAPAFAAMAQAGVHVHMIPSQKTTLMKVIHPSANVDERQMFQLASAGFIETNELPQVDARYVHLAGVTDQEFSLELIEHLRRGPWKLSADMQSFVRQVNPATREIAFADVRDKRRIVSLLDMVKLDAVEAKIVTGHDDLDQAAREVQSWGAAEVMITRSDGVLVRAGGESVFERFTNRSTVGRTGRGDTTFAAYLAWRMEHSVTESTRFAAALVSVKMETPGPFQGTLSEVLERMKQHG